MATTTTIDWKDDAGWGGVLGWCNSIRTRMVNDPGVRDVHEYVKYQGHHWLDEYLEDILLNPTAGAQSMVELAKTPGRRKDPLRLGRTPMHASVRKPVAVASDKENPPAISAFAQKLLQSRDDGAERPALQPVGNSPFRPSSVPDVFSEPPQPHTSDNVKEEKDVEHLVSSPVRVEADLSVIAEDAEARDASRPPSPVPTAAARPPPLDLSKPTRSSHESEYHTAPSTAVPTTDDTARAEKSSQGLKSARPLPTSHDEVVPMDTATDDTTTTSLSSAGGDNTTRSFPRHTERGFPVLKAPSPVKRESSVAPTVPGARASWFVRAVAKRKSDERGDEDDEDSDDEANLRRKAHKLLKTQADSNVKSDQQAQALRKTMLNKSLGGPDAAAKAAKAAAEARLAERATATEDKPAQGERNGRLSVSDLVTRMEEKKSHSGSARDTNDDSTSTTPPDSPMAQPPRPASRPLPVPPAPTEKLVLIPPRQPAPAPAQAPILHPPATKSSILQPPPTSAPILQPRGSAAPAPAKAPILQPPSSAVPRESAARILQPPASQVRPSTQKTGPTFFPPPSFVPTSSAAKGASTSFTAPPPTALPAFPKGLFLPSSPSQASSFLRTVSSATTLSAQSTAVSDLFDSQPQQSTQDTEWDDEPAPKPFDARMVPDETRFWDKTQNRVVPGAWDGAAMEIDDEWASAPAPVPTPAENMDWSGDEEDAEGSAEPMEITAPQTQPAHTEKKGGLFSQATSILSRALYGSTSGTNANAQLPVPVATRPAPPAPVPVTQPKPKEKGKEKEKDKELAKEPDSDAATSKKERSRSPSEQPSTLVKSVQAANVLKKKDQEQQSKKATIISNMEARRLANAQRKKEEEEARAAELERKQREEIEKRKREREAEEKRLRPPIKKAPSDDESNKKRKLEVKKPTAALKESVVKKGPAPDSRPGSRIGKPNFGASTSSQIVAPSKSQIRGPTPAPTPSVKLVQQPPPPAELPAPPAFTPSAPPATTMIPTKNKFPPASSQGPAKALQEQMQARLQAQRAAASGEPAVEDIELPEINSEYSDSDDEDRKRTFDPPEWATSPKLKQILRDQQRVDPDEVFGAIREINLEDIFRGDKTRHSKFRARSSSANWAGTDGLTVEEKEAYSIRMGYKNTTLTKQNTM